MQAMIRTRTLRRNKQSSYFVRILRDLTICLLMLFPYLLIPVS